MSTTAWATVIGTRIKVYDDEWTQSVNICMPSGVEGVYAQVSYFCGSYRTTAEEIGRHTNLETLTAFLRERSYNQLFSVHSLVN